MIILENISLLDASKLFKEMVEKVMRGLGSMTDNYPILLYQLIAILILAIVIKVFFLGKINKYLDKQRYNMIKNRLETEKERNEALKYKEMQKKAYNQLKEENRNIREQVRAQAVLEAEKIREEAKEQAKQRLARVEQEINQQYKQNEDKIKQSIIEISYVAAEKILKQELDHSKYDPVIEQVTKEMLDKEVNETE